MITRTTFVDALQEALAIRTSPFPEDRAAVARAFAEVLDDAFSACAIDWVPGIGTKVDCQPPVQDYVFSEIEFWIDLGHCLVRFRSIDGGKFDCQIWDGGGDPLRIPLDDNDTPLSVLQSLV